ncbi:hypothetical protein CEXT_580951 [Caerostris extrusa]|uniref:Uncharacterized protein n=1 Tax=Caerostris extrusa TaxID=172846 RepID=A0AAV4MQT9_CAEEX|nr:hypothetical protein CEXT_580951 [Caerostris extrusa]
MKRLRASFKFPLHIEMLSSTVLLDIYTFHLSILPQLELNSPLIVCAISAGIRVFLPPVLCKENFHTTFSRGAKLSEKIRRQRPVFEIELLLSHLAEEHRNADCIYGNVFKGTLGYFSSSTSMELVKSIR